MSSAHGACTRCGAPAPDTDSDDFGDWAEYWGLFVCPGCMSPDEIVALQNSSD